jgi:hypothetical protein
MERVRAAAGGGIGIFVLAAVADGVVGAVVVVFVLTAMVVAGVKEEAIRGELVVDLDLESARALRQVRVAGVAAPSQHGSGVVDEAFVEAFIEL